MTAIIAILLIALNLPMTVALFMGIKTYTNSTCEEDQRSARHNRMMLKGIAMADVVMGIVLFIASL